MKVTSYTVEGQWPFPTDMLRHDQARAASDEDKRKIEYLSGVHMPEGYDLSQKIRIDLVIEDGGPFRPNTQRWESFDWDVVGSPTSRTTWQRKEEPVSAPEEGAADPVRSALLRCRECWEDDQDVDVGRDKLDALTVFGLLRKVGRGRWEITPAGMALLREPVGDHQPPKESGPHHETVRKCEEIARFFVDNEFREIAPGFIRGIAYASESIACEISDLLAPDAPRRPILSAPDEARAASSSPLSATDFQLLFRLLEENKSGGSRPVIEKDGWEQALRLSDTGLLAIEQLGSGGRLHITRLGAAAVRAAMNAPEKISEGA